MHSKHYTRAALFALTAYSGWAISDAMQKFARMQDVPRGQIMMLSAFSGLVALFLLSAFRGNIHRLKPQKWGGLTLLGAAQAASGLCWLTAMPYLPLATMYVVIFMTPMTVATLAALVLKEPLGWKRAVAIATGFMGVLIAVDPLQLMAADAHAWMPYIAVFCGMLLTSVQMLTLRVVSQKESSECTSFYPRFVVLAAAAVGNASTGFVPMTPSMGLLIGGTGVLGAVGWVLMSQAYKNASAAAVVPFHYSQIVSGAVLGYVVWGDKPTINLAIGAAIIIVSGIYLVRHERRVSARSVVAE
jgi:S-adenosylmethionine uptake transporter